MPYKGKMTAGVLGQIGMFRIQMEQENAIECLTKAGASPQQREDIIKEISYHRGAIWLTIPHLSQKDLGLLAKAIEINNKQNTGRERHTGTVTPSLLRLYNSFSVEPISVRISFMEKAGMKKEMVQRHLVEEGYGHSPDKYNLKLDPNNLRKLANAMNMYNREQVGTGKC